jgi:hypothetical protein
MKRKCVKCGMIRSVKDLVNLEAGKYICFTCWNKLEINSEKNK